MPKMVSLKPHRFGGRALSEGDQFSCDERYVPVLEKLGRAQMEKPATKVAETQSGEQYATREISGTQRKKSTRRKRSQ